MIAMRYGTVPVVRETGGLKDSVINFDKYNAPEGNGFSFANFNAHELLFTIKRGLTCFAEKPLWEKIVSNAMHSDNSWRRSAQAYADLYAKIAGETITVEPVSEEQVEKTTEEILQAVKGEEAVKEPDHTVAAVEETKETEAAITEENAVEEKTVAEEAPQTVTEEVVAEAVQVIEQEPTVATEADANTETAVSEPETESEVAAEPVKKKPAAKRTTKKAATKTTTTKKAESKKTTTRKTATKKSAAVTEEGTETKKTSAKKTTTRKKADKTADVTTEAIETAAPKKRGRKPGSKNKTKDAES